MMHKIFLLLVLFIYACQSAGEKEDSTTAKASYTGSTSCMSCHAEAYQDWITSDHFLAMQPANDSTVAGDFNDVLLTADGITSRFFRKGDKYMIHTEGDDGQYHEFEVAYTFGYYPLQQYLVTFPGGRMQATRVSWDARDKKWFHQYANQQVAHWDWLHWTGNAQNWNTMCASCHSTDLQKQYDPGTDTYHTTWKEINVTCESCHGPGSEHIRYVNSRDYQKGKPLINSGFVYSRDTISKRQIMSCVACHARKSDVQSGTLDGRDLLNTMIPQVISDEFYFADGQIREEVYEFGSFTQSKMFHHNVRCTSCHNPHSGKTRLEGNNLCLSCHKPSYAAEAHHFHAENSEGAQCVNCHMTTRTYMGNDHRRDHSFRVPRPDQTVLYGTPNACNGCHQDQTPKWAADAVSKWYGPKRTYHFSDDLIPGSKLDEKSESHLLKLLADTTQPDIARATAAYYLGRLGWPSSIQGLMHALNDDASIIRYYALRALAVYPMSTWSSKVPYLLTDSVKAVRIAAADLLHQSGTSSLSEDQQQVYAAADAENKDFLTGQLDFAVGNVMMADYKMQGGAYQDAVMYYRKGLRKDSLMNYARFNLATAYNLMGQNQEALKVLEDAAAIDAFNDRVFYSLGLLQYEMNKPEEAIRSFQKAVDLKSFNPSLYYNYGLLLQQLGRNKAAEHIFREGIRMDPGSPDLHYAISLFYLQSGQRHLALPYIGVLYRDYRGQPEYQQLFEAAGLSK